MRPWIFLAGLGGVIAVGMGAYAAHGLAGDEIAQALAERGSQYQLLHCLALLGADRVASDSRRGGVIAHLSALLFLAGMVLFCGSLYLKALTGPALARSHGDPGRWHDLDGRLAALGGGRAATLKSQDFAGLTLTRINLGDTLTSF